MHFALKNLVFSVNRLSCNCSANKGHLKIYISSETLAILNAIFVTQHLLYIFTYLHLHEHMSPTVVPEL